MNIINYLEEQQLRDDLPDFKPGDTIKVHVRIREGEKERIQIFEGICIRKRGTSVNASFSVLKETHGDIVEKIFPLYSPTIDKIKVIRKGKAKRAKLYNLRKKK